MEKDERREDGIIFNFDWKDWKNNAVAMGSAKGDGCAKLGICSVKITFSFFTFEGEER